jgi:hypothetical protein
MVRVPGEAAKVARKMSWKTRVENIGRRRD